MKLILSIFVVYLAFGECDHITHNEKATSYQSIHMEHFHAVPTYIKKEDKQLLEHPISLGKTASKVEVHHGDKHDPGYALTDVHNGVQHPQTELHDFSAAYALSNAEGHENIKYETEGAGNTEFGHYQQFAAGENEQASFTANHGLGNYQTFHDSR